MELAPCKINLTLDILGKRPDGYHTMRMVMQSVSLCDRLSLRETTEGGFVLRAAGLALPAGTKTLEQRAAESFFHAIGRPVPSLEAVLEKVTPAYAGLGGGSADVAALLRLLRRRYAPAMPEAELERIGLTVGSDVPFCLRGGAALAEGRGEILTDLPPLPACGIVLCKPDYGLSTPELFARMDQAALGDRPNTDGMLAALEQGDLAAAASCLGNVFESALTIEERRDVDGIRNTMLHHGALGAVMSGSGPAVFGIFPAEQDAGQAVDALRKRYAQTYLAHPMKKWGQAV